MPRNEGQEIPEPLPREQDVAAVVDADIPNLPYVRLTQRVRPPRERRSLWMLLALVLAGHVLLAWLAWLILRPAPYRRLEGGAFMVTLIEPSQEIPPPPPLPPPLPGQPAPPLVHREQPAPGAITATMEGVKTPPLNLYDSNGQIRLSAGAAKSSAPAPAYSAPGLQGSHIYSGEPPVTYKPTRFNKDWAPANQSLGAKAAHKVGEVFGKAVDKTTLKKTVKVGGTRIHCAIAPLLLFAAGCAPEAPPPPPKNDDDIRLSMPPPETLTGKKVVLPKSASSVAKPASAASTPAVAPKASPPSSDSN